MKFLYVTLRLGGVCTDNDDDDANADDTRLHKALWLVNQMSQQVYDLKVHFLNDKFGCTVVYSLDNIKYFPFLSFVLWLFLSTFALNVNSTMKGYSNF